MIQLGLVGTSARHRSNGRKESMSYIVHVVLEENGNGNLKNVGTVHLDGKYEFKNLEIAREAAQVACHAAGNLKPRRSKQVDDDDWTVHPDRTDD